MLPVKSRTQKTHFHVKSVAGKSNLASSSSHGITVGEAGETGSNFYEVLPYLILQIRGFYSVCLFVFNNLQLWDVFRIRGILILRYFDLANYLLIVLQMAWDTACISMVCSIWMARKWDLHLVKSQRLLTNCCYFWHLSDPAKVYCPCVLRAHVVLERLELLEGRFDPERRSRQGFIMLSKPVLWHLTPIQNS